MAQLSGGAVIAAMHMAGWPSSQWRTGAAVAYGESSWNSTAKGPTSDFGLFQIHEPSHPEKIASGDWRNPVDNAKMALKIYRGRGNSWRPWVAYTNGNFRQHLAKADQAMREHQMAHSAAGESPTGSSSNADQVLLTQSGAQASDTFSGTGDGEGVFAALAEAVRILTDPRTWVRIGMGIAGVGLIIFGSFWLIRTMPQVKAAFKTAASVIPIGKVGNAVRSVAQGATQGGGSDADTDETK